MQCQQRIAMPAPRQVLLGLQQRDPVIEVPWGVPLPLAQAAQTATRVTAQGSAVPAAAREQAIGVQGAEEIETRDDRETEDACLVPRHQIEALFGALVASRQEIE